MAEIRARGVIQFVAREGLFSARRTGRARGQRASRDLMKERRETEKHDDKGREVRDISATTEEEGYVERREGRVRARRVDVGRTRTRRTRDRDSEEERERDVKRGAKKEERSEVKGYAERRKERGRREASGTRRSRGGLRQDAVPSRYTSLRT